MSTDKSEDVTCGQIFLTSLTYLISQCRVLKYDVMSVKYQQVVALNQS